MTPSPSHVRFHAHGCVSEPLQRPRRPRSLANASCDACAHTTHLTLAAQQGQPGGHDRHAHCGHADRAQVQGANLHRIRSSSSPQVTKEAGTFWVAPQPKDMPEGWEQAVALNPDFKTGNFIYHKCGSALPRAVVTTAQSG